MIKLYVAKLPIQNTILVQNYNEFQPKNDSNSDIRICDLAVFFPVPFISSLYRTLRGPMYISGSVLVIQIFTKYGTYILRTGP